MKKKAIIFDLWNTLVVKRGHSFTSIIADYYSLSFDSVYEWIRLSSLVKDKNDKYYYLRMICQANSIEFKEKDKLFLDEVYQKYYEECEWIKDAKETLIELRSLGYKIGILSNSSEISYNVIDKFGVRKYVDAIVLSCEVGFLKPDPRIFQSMLNNLQVTSEETIMIGDKITTDVLGAKVMEMDMVFFNSNEKENIYNENLTFVSIINNLKEIINIVNNFKYENNEIFSIDVHSGK